MSFSKDTKNELAHVIADKDCCKLAEIAGFIRVCGSVGLEGFGKYYILMHTDNPAIARHFKSLIREYFDVDAMTGMEITKNSKKVILKLQEEQNAEAILRETGMLMIKGGMNYFTDGIYDGIIKSKCCRKAYLRGAFLAWGTMTDPKKGYHLEITCNSDELATDLRKLLRSFNDKKYVEITPKIVKRDEKYGVYIKSRQQIIDILSIMEAKEQCRIFVEELEKKDQVTKTRRAMNCDTANMNKMLKASERQTRAIRIIRDTIGLEKLKPELLEVALLRLDYPDIQLADIGEMMDPPVGRSGIYKRFKKIEEIAEKLENGEGK